MKRKADPCWNWSEDTSSSNAYDSSDDDSYDQMNLLGSPVRVGTSTLHKEEVLEIMVHDSLDEGFRRTQQGIIEKKEQESKRRKALAAALTTNPIYSPLFEERFGEFVRKGVLHAPFYNHSSVTAATDCHPLKDVWSIIRHFHYRLYLNKRWLDGRVQIFTCTVLDAINDFDAWHDGDIILRQFHYNVGESIGVFAHWHKWLTTVKDFKRENKVKHDTVSLCQYWSTSSNKVHEWESVQMA